MLHHVDVQNKMTSAPPTTLSLSSPTNGFVIKGIEGLDPVKATLVSSSFANLDGEQYHSGRREKRNIIVSLGLKHKTIPVAQLRKSLYNLFMPKTEVILSFYQADGTYVSISGVVETCEAPPFSKEPGMDISILCFDPDFVSPEVGSLTGGTVTVGGHQTYEYKGTIPTGMTIVVDVNQTTNFLDIWHLRLGGPAWRTMRLNSSFIAGDKITINTVRGSRSVRRLREGVTTSGIHYVARGAIWPELIPGMNQFTIFAQALNIPYSASWSIRHGGL